MVFPGLFGSSSSSQNRSRSPHHPKSRGPKGQDQQPSSSSSATDLLPHPSPLADAGPMDYIAHEAQLRPVPEPEPDLRELNNCLEALAAVFPDVQVEVFREMLYHFDGESRLAVVADALLKNQATWIKGRWRVAGGQAQQDKKAKAGKSKPPKKAKDASAAAGAAATHGAVLPNEVFRSDQYKKAVRNLAWSEFKGLSKSTVNAVLAESNFSYLEARPTLVSISSKSWRFTISSLFRRRPTASSISGSPSPGDGEPSHPLVLWKSSGRGATIPAIRPTGSPELDRELYDVLIRPIKHRIAALQLAKDHALAREYNTKEAEKEGMVYECSCCYTDVPFEEITACSADGHFVCFGCVQRSVTEAVFGQGWHSSIDVQKATLKCLSVEADSCPGHVPRALLQRAMQEDKKGAEILRKLDSRLAEHSLLDSKLTLVRCPFCDYAEVDEVYHPDGAPRHRIRASIVLKLMILAGFGFFVPFLPFAILVCVFLCILVNSSKTLGDRLLSEWSLAVARHDKRRFGSKFTCHSPACGRSSCLSCSKAWVDVHVCNESSLIALRTQVEQAMSMAVKRVCPRCNTSFVKTTGCNKLTCPCGYKMCYVCRADLSEEGYRHFCEHFRPVGCARPCTECDRCNLWESEDTDRVLKEAKEEAERKWREAERRDLTGSEKAFLETGVASKETTSMKVFKHGWRPDLAEVMDVIVDSVLF